MVKGFTTGTVLTLVACFAPCMIAATDVVPFDDGTCLTYPADGYCGGIGLADVSVMLFGSGKSQVDLRARDAQLEGFLSALETAAQSVATPECVQNFKLFICYGWFPPCSSAGNPLRPCYSSCLSLWEPEMCKNAFDLAITMNIGSSVPLCDQDTVGDQARVSQSSYLHHYFSEWKDEPIFVDDTYTATGPAGPEPGSQCASIDGIEIACPKISCAEPLIANFRPKYKDPNAKFPEFAVPDDLEYCENMNSSSFDCERCTYSCSLACPYPLIYDDSQLASQWYSVWVPGLFSVLLNLLVFVSETVKLRKQKRCTRKRTKISDRLVQMSALCALALFILETAPAMALKEDVRCNGVQVQDTYWNGQNHDFCVVGKFRHWFLLALMGTVVCNLYKVANQLKAATNMKKYAVSKTEQANMILVIFGCPFLLALIAGLTAPNQLMHQSVNYRQLHWDGAQENTTSYSISQLADFEKREKAATMNFKSLWHANSLRGMYACQFFFDTINMELGLYTIPLITYGVVCMFISIYLLLLVRRMGSGKQLSKNRALYTLAINMLRFAFVAILLVIINATVLFNFMPKAETFGDQLNGWNECLSSGIRTSGFSESGGDGGLGNVNTNKTLAATLMHCGNPTGFKAQQTKTWTDAQIEQLYGNTPRDQLVDDEPWAPSSSIIVGLYLTQSLPCLVFGMVFSIPAVKTLLHTAKNKLASVAPTTSMMSTSS